MCPALCSHPTPSRRAVASEHPSTSGTDLQAARPPLQGGQHRAGSPRDRHETACPAPLARVLPVFQHSDVSAGEAPSGLTHSHADPRPRSPRKQAAIGGLRTSANGRSTSLPVSGTAPAYITPRCETNTQDNAALILYSSRATPVSGASRHLKRGSEQSGATPSAKTRGGVGQSLLSRRKEVRPPSLTCRNVVWSGRTSLRTGALLGEAGVGGRPKGDGCGDD